MKGPALIGIVLTACAATLSATGCGRRAPAPAPQPSTASVAPPAPTVDPSRLPEDPAAGRRSEEQWRKHMADEEHERQIGFDKRHLTEHRAVVALIAAARARYDRAGSEAALAQARTDMPRRIDEIRGRVTALDHWGVNSRLLEDYAALEKSLEQAYADARLASLKGDAHSLDEARADFERRMKAIADWLEEAAESEDESDPGAPAREPGAAASVSK
jgi:hypothetical protein